MATDTGGLTVVRARELRRGFGDRVVLRDLDLDIARGEFVALLGRSGSGKSTLLRALAELDYDVPGSGEMSVPTERSVVSRTPGCCRGCGCSTT